MLTVVAIACAFAVVHNLPDGDAYADPLVVKTKDVHSISIDGGRGLPMAALRDAMETTVGAKVSPLDSGPRSICKVAFAMLPVICWVCSPGKWAENRGDACCPTQPCSMKTIQIYSCARCHITVTTTITGNPCSIR